MAIFKWLFGKEFVRRAISVEYDKLVLAVNGGFLGDGVWRMKEVATSSGGYVSLIKVDRESGRKVLRMRITA